MEHPELIRSTADGKIVIGNSRVSLDTVVGAFLGAAQHIAEQYPSLTTAQVIATIKYYLYFREEVDLYLRLRSLEAAALQDEIEKDMPPLTREDLLARKAARESLSRDAG